MLRCAHLTRCAGVTVGTLTTLHRGQLLLARVLRHARIQGDVAQCRRRHDGVVCGTDQYGIDVGQYSQESLPGYRLTVQVTERVLKIGGKKHFNPGDIRPWTTSGDLYSSLWLFSLNPIFVKLIIENVTEGPTKTIGEKYPVISNIYSWLWEYS